MNEVSTRIGRVVRWEKWFVRGFNLINPLKVLRKEGI
jgi:hypothetical protein